MKRNINISSFKTFIKKSVTVFASREFAFLYCILGTVGQVAHCYFLIESISSFNGFFKTLQAILMAVFISSSLMYFVAIADKDDEPQEYKRVMRGVNLFMYIEILMNLYYYCRHLIIDSPEMRLFDFLFGAVISTLIPVTIKMYSNSIKAKQWIKEIESKKETTEVEEPKQNVSILKGDIEESIKKYIDTVIVPKLIEKYPNIDNVINTKISEFIKGDSNIMDEIRDTILNDVRFKQIDINDVDYYYRDKILNKIEEVTKANNQQFYKDIESKIEKMLDARDNKK